MSDRLCNLCVFRELKRKHKGKKVEDWLRVCVGGEPLEIWFLEMGSRCAC
jgi:hypothetical protein